MIKTCRIRLAKIGHGPFREPLQRIEKREPFLTNRPFRAHPVRSVSRLDPANLDVTAGPRRTFGRSAWKTHSSGFSVVGMATADMIEWVSPESILRTRPGKPRDRALCIPRLAPIGYRPMGQTIQKAQESGRFWNKTSDRPEPLERGLLPGNGSPHA